MKKQQNPTPSKSDAAAGGSLVSQATYARHRGVSRQYISQLCAAGALIMRDSLVDVKASDAVLDESDPADESEPSTLAAARLVKEVYLGKLHKLEFERRSGELVALGDVEAAVGAMIGNTRARILQLPSSLAPELALLTDPDEVRVVLEREVHSALLELSGYNPANEQQVSPEPAGRRQRK